MEWCSFMKIKFYPEYLVHRIFTKGRENFFKEGYEFLYPEYAESGLSPWQHYVIYGAGKGYDNGNHPSPDSFFPEGYLVEYPDVVKAGMDPWRHYVRYGRKEGRDNGLHPGDNMFFSQGYLKMYQDVAREGIDPWKHYVLYGRKEGRDNGLHPGGNIFFADGYLEMYQDVARAQIDPWKHYVLRGKMEGRDNGYHPSGRVFCKEGYLLNHPDLKNAGVDLWKHYCLSCKNRKISNYLDDYEIRLVGHDQEIVRSIYLTPYRAARTGTKTKRALFIGHDLTINGAPLSLLSVAKILISDGYLVDIAVKNNKHINEIYMYDGIGADVFLFPDSTEVFPGADRIIGNYDLVIVNTVVMAAYAELCKKLNVPHIWFIREDLFTIRKFFQKINSCKERFLDDYENILCVSKYVTECVYNEFKIRCRYINNFIEDITSSVAFDGQKKKEQNTSGRVVKFAVVGYESRIKSQQTALSALLYISANPQYKDKWKLLFIGDVSDRSNLKFVSRNVPNVIWCGVVTEKKWELFKSIDFFIVPSLEEASSRVAIEAAMLGKPLIVTTHVGAKYLTDNNAGFLFEPENAMELRNIITKCIDMTADEYRSMSRQVRLNYEKTSSLPVYHKVLSEFIKDAYDRRDASADAETLNGSSEICLRSLSTGGNVISFENFEYVNYANFGYGMTLSGHGNGINSTLSERISPVGVVVPVYNGIEHLKVLLPSLFKNTDLPHKIIFVDDCSDEETSAYLAESTRNRDDCLLITNENNLGFVKSVNIGAAKALEYCTNFVMLNSDTEVPSGWLSRLMRPILLNKKISSATPLSNRCNIFSFPFSKQRDKNDAFLAAFGVEGINEAVRLSGVCGEIRIPTGHGFCMGVSGSVWKKIGGLNEVLFGRGYGEENEWSLRAELDGFYNVLVPDLYVAHHENGSFLSEEKRQNIESSQRVISSMFPLYHTSVRNFLREYPLSDSIVSVFLSLARQKGYKTEEFSDASLFQTRISGDDGIFVFRHQGVTKVAVKLLGEVILVGNAANFDQPEAEEAETVNQ